ncbi:MAG: enoyl-CoA hydratase-related protein [Acidimicrobiales bacterium]
MHGRHVGGHRRNRCRSIAHSGARAVVLTGAGEFCAGADLSRMRADDGSASSDAAAARTMVDAMRVLADVVLAVLPGPGRREGRRVVREAGLGLALAADLAWCSDRARFSAVFAVRPEHGLRLVVVAPSARQG